MDKLNFLLVFMEGILSLFSPCILPILPVYLSILSNSSIKNLKDGQIKFFNSSLFKNTVLFVLGISTTFFILGSSVSILNYFFMTNKNIILIISGIVIILMGLFYLGWIDIPVLQRQRQFKVNTKEMKPLTAYLLGFSFSFGWTPCIGPILSSVLIMASTSDSVLTGNLLILVYTIGFILPFILIAIFYSKLFRILDKIQLHLDILQKIAGTLLLVTGIVMVLGGPNKTLGYLKNVVSAPITYLQEDKYNDIENKTEDSNISDNENKYNNTENSSNVNPDSTTENELKASDFTLVDQYGNTHKLSDYKGKVVFLNFWATWCPPCKEEMPHIEEIYNEYKNNDEDVVILGIAAPNLGREGSKEYITGFLNDNNYTFPVAFDETTEVLEQYYISAFPTTFIIDKEGNIIKYIPGAMDKETMKTLIEEVR
jgi:cytochrome c-type biogenesis protein